MIITFNIKDKKEIENTKRFTSLNKMCREISSETFKENFGSNKVSEIIVNNELISFFGSAKDLYSILKQVNQDIMMNQSYH